MLRDKLDGFSVGGFQCPDNGIPCVLLFDEDREMVYAEVENNGFDYLEEQINEAEKWCKRFGVKHCETEEDAVYMCREIEER
jgi:hypothetical protein